MKLINHKQGSKEWLEIRRKGIGASEAPIIMNVSPWQTPYGLWMQKMSGEEKAMNASMRYGKETEDEERKAFEKMVGLTFFPDMTFVSKERSWQIASLDGIDFDQTIIMEIKQANAEDHETAKNGKVPEKYFPQLQHQFAVCERINTNLYCSSHKGNRCIVEVKRDDAYIEALIKEEEKFYEEHILKGVSPELMPKDYVEMADERWNDLAILYKNVDREIKNLEKEKEKHKNALVSLCNGRSSKGSGVVLTLTKPLGLIDYKAIPELFGVDLDKYRKAGTERWTLRTA